ncbi:probable pleckstrin homology domain-containing family N member 1 isoform X2 [Bombina bombina]|uniref:probable pleckstrin homology domain-containing family N member 1 isoform X2 n=1 Tax=Bombina bombina TaxID=8345 RepID=UPI00235A53A0|nr:probable pleckstrin homology domain-containing family N member 1 isoform X2 [Bombina bombina]
MGCCSVTARGNKSTPDGHEEAELLHRDESRKQSEVGSPNGGTCISAQQILTSENVGSYSVEDKQFKSKPVLFWGKTREHLNDQIFKEPIRGWEGQHVYSYGRVVMSSLVVIQISSTQEMSECFLVLFPLHLLILSMDNQERRFIYQGLLPLSGMSVLCTQTSTGHTFQINGPMIEPRQVTCLNYNDKNLWISTLQDHIHEANIHSSPVTPCLSILSYLVPCDKLWKKNELMQYLTSCPIQLWEGKAIQHMGKAIFLSTVQVSHTIDGAYEERILVLFPDDLVFLSVDPDRTTVTHQGTLPLNAVRVYESLAWNGRLEFQITGEFMEPILISCMTASDYNQWIFHLQKPEQDNCAVNLRPLISLPARYRR